MNTHTHAHTCTRTHTHARIHCTNKNEMTYCMYDLPIYKECYTIHKYEIHCFITKTCLYNFDPLKPYFYIVKLGFTGVYIIFLISAQKHRLWVLVRTAEAVLTSTHNLCFEQKYEKYQNFLSKNFQFLVVKFSIYLNRRVFVMWHSRSLLCLCRLQMAFASKTRETKEQLFNEPRRSKKAVIAYTMVYIAFYRSL